MPVCSGGTPAERPSSWATLRRAAPSTPTLVVGRGRARRGLPAAPRVSSSMRGNMSPVRPFTLDLVPGASLYGHISRRWGLCRFRAWEGRCAETCLQWHSLVCPVSVDAGTGVPTPRTWAWSRGWGTAGRLGAGMPNPRGTRRNPPEAGSSHGRPDVTRPGPATPEGDECGETWDEARAASTTRPCKSDSRRGDRGQGPHGPRVRAPGTCQWDCRGLPSDGWDCAGVGT